MGFKTEERGFYFRILSNDQIYTIHLAALEILERTGIVVKNVEALEMLHSTGCFISKSNRVRIPSFLIDRALQQSPKKIVVGNRDGNRVMFLEGYNTYFGPNVDQPILHDPYSGNFRDFLIKDVKTSCTLADFMPNEDYVCYGGTSSDIPEEIVSRETFKVVVQSTKKPIIFCCFKEKGTREIIEIATAIRGGEENLRQNPYIIHYSEPTSPLTHDNEPVKNILLCADKGVPLIYIPMPIAGATAPATFAAVLAQNVAEVLSGLLIMQLRKEGSPFIFGGIPSVMDMSPTMIYPYGAPEMDLMSAALTDIAHYYGLPMFGTVGCDAKLPDQQCAIEATNSCFMSMLSGAQLVHDIGQIQGKILSLETIVMIDEIIEMLRYTLKPITINDETLALGLIDRVGPGGNYLMEEHTLKHFREWWFPKLIDRTSYKNWIISEKQSFTEKLNKKVIQIIETHTVEQLSKDIIDFIKNYKS